MIRDVGHVESIKEVKRIYRIVIGETGKKKIYLENLAVNGRIISSSILGRQNERCKNVDWIQLAQETVK